jgi:hypothetical protein
MEQNPVLVQTKDDIRRFNGQEVTTIGRYQAIVQPIKGLVRKELPKDRALLKLADGTEVYLEPLDSPKSRRHPNEIKQLDGKLVQIRGIIYIRMPSRGASLIAPCIADVTEIHEEQ